MHKKSILFAWALLATALSGPPALAAQDASKILRVAAFGGDGVQPGEASALQNLVTSYIIELKMFRVIDDSGQELALKEAETAIQLGTQKELNPLSADYVLAANASKVGSYIVFTMDVTKVTSGEKKSVADTFNSVNDLILAARRLTRNLFARPDASASLQAGQGARVGAAQAPARQSQASPARQSQAPDAAAAPEPTAPAQAAPAPSAAPDSATVTNPSLSQISGTWKGDKNVDHVTILPDGRGFAILSSGIRMALKASIEGSVIVIVQDQPNSPDFYRPGLDLKSARTVAAAARPWRWVFSLSQDGGNLSGVKESVFVNVSEKGAISIDNAYVRDAVWTRLYR